MAKQSGWTYGGSAQFGSYGAGSSGDKTDFKSEVKIISASNKGRSSKAESSEGYKTITYSGVERQDTINWSVQTLCDSKGISDRVNIVLSYYDPFYIGQLANQIIEDLSPEQMQDVIDGDTSAVETLVESKLDVNRAIKQIYSTTVITDTSEGKASGTIKIGPEYPFADYVLLFHYGYSNLSERPDSEKKQEFLLDTGLLVGEILLVVVGSVLSGGTLAPFLGTTLVATGTVVGLADIARAGAMYLSSGFGAIDQNRQGCLFPATGYNHTYTFTLDEPVILTDPETGETSETSAKNQNILSQMSEKSLNEYQSLIGSGQLATGQAVQIIAVGGLVIAALLITLKRGDA